MRLVIVLALLVMGTSAASRQMSASSAERFKRAVDNVNVNVNVGIGESANKCKCKTDEDCEKHCPGTHVCCGQIGPLGGRCHVSAQECLTTNRCGKNCVTDDYCKKHCPGKPNCLPFVGTGCEARKWKPPRNS